MRFLLGVLMMGAAALPTWAAPVLDGSISGDGYSTRTLQTVQTGFGGGFNEFAGAYAQVDAGTLYLTITGKIESFNKMALFIDSVAGGENTLTASTGSGGNNPGNDNFWADRYAGFDFDGSFAADYLVIARAGFDGTNNRFDLDFNSVGNTSVVESNFLVFGASQTGSNPNVGGTGIGVAYDNSLTGGSIGGGTGSANNPQNITSGVEFAIPLSKLGNPDLQDVKITAILSNGNYDFLSNQLLGGLPVGTDNLGNDGFGNIGHINLNDFAEEQCFSIVPEPSSIALACLAMVGILGLGRRRK